MELASCGFYLNKKEIDFLNLKTELSIMNCMGYSYEDKLYKCLNFLFKNFRFLFDVEIYGNDFVFELAKGLIKEKN